MLVEINNLTHNIICDLRYAKENNFTQKVIYKKEICLIHKDALVLLERAIELALRQNLRLKIFDAFRPKAAQEKLWQLCPNDKYVMPPSKGSVHTRGIAVDLTLVDANGNDLDMGSSFDDFTEKSHHGYNHPPLINMNRYLLLGIMTTAGFDFFYNEWWHYQMFYPKNYELIENNHEIM